MPSLSKLGAAQAMAGTNLVLSQLRNSLTGPTGKAVRSFVQILRDNFAAYSWVGVYLVKGDNLVLEAYAGDGATEHVTIPIARGYAGQQLRPKRQLRSTMSAKTLGT